ncbi:hypothetical protein BD311DRAFT_690392 [Dichomitus squalens]|uniref:RING-type E3 ubiquitin transferase n=1 Tax=Dichomitus squalens TaxID=114155 RepID=A0A4Q9MSN6_9APHY|nr:hypothetical protein BD311DRAFT_690392 [Dichomitus squalens]
MTQSTAATPARPCLYYRQGSCTRGVHCKFSHGIASPNGPPQSSQTVRDRGKPPVTTVCGFYRQGTCRFGDSCLFSHPSSSSGHLSNGTDTLAAPATRPTANTIVSYRALSESTTFGSCKFYARGACNKGTACPFSHPATAIVPKGESDLSSMQASAFGSVACKFFVKGNCSKGSTCSFWHSQQQAGNDVNIPPISEVADVVSGVAPVTGADIASARGGDGSFSPKQTSAVERGEAAKSDSTSHDEQPSVDRTKFGCKIVYGPGGCVQDIETAFESTIVLLHNIPSSVTHTQLVDLAEPFGPVKSVIIIPARDGVSPTSGRIEYVQTAGAARAAAELGNAKGLRGATARLDLRAAESGKAVLRSTKAKLSWFAPSLVAWAHYATLSKAREQAKRLDGQTFRGATLHASFQTPSRYQRSSFSVELKGLPLDTSSASLKIFTRSDSVALGSPSFMIEDSVRELRKLLATYGSLEAFDFAPPAQGKYKLVAFVQFADADKSERAAAMLHTKRQSFLRGSPIFLELVHSIKYMLPSAQFQVLRPQIDALREILQTCKLRYHDKDEYGREAERVCIRAYGPDAKGLGRLKTEIELLLAGDPVLDADGQVAWHDHYSTASGTQVLSSIATQTDTYIKCDARIRTLHLFGDQHGRTAAKTRLFVVLAKLQAQEHLLDLDQEAFRRMLHGGYQELQTAYEDKVRFDVVRRRLVLRGDESEVRAIRESVAGQLGGGQRVRSSIEPDDGQCPVCFCDTAEPLTLPCGHCYCRACLQHYLSSVGQSQGGSQVFAACLAETTQPNGSRRACGRGVPLGIIRSLLSPGEEEQLLEATLLSHVHSRPQEFHYCPTADCQTIYRSSADDTVLRCPSCLARICASCHVEFHEGLTCVEFKDNVSGGNEAFRRWREENGIKSCPSCKADLEKSGGCNHMTCARCGTHMCWVCLKTFNDIDSGGGVYAHMRREHGGIGI